MGDFQFVEKAVLKGDQANRIAGLRHSGSPKQRQRPRLRPMKNWNLFQQQRHPAAEERGGCGGGGRAQPLDPKIEQEAKAKGLEYYEKKTQKKGASAKVTNFGCHIQVDIIEDGKVVVSLTYKQGEVQEI